MKKTLALVLAAAMVFSLAACGSSNSSSAAKSEAPAAAASSAKSEAPAAAASSAKSEAPAAAASSAKSEAPAPAKEGGYYIGTNTWGSGVPNVDMIGDSRQYALELFGCEVNRSSDDFTADKELQNGQNMIAAGVDGICFQGGAPNVVVQIAALAKEQNIPITFDTQIGTEEILSDLAANNDMYLGAIDANCTLAGEQLAQRAWDDGCKTAIIIGGNIGDVNMDQRSEGFTRVFEGLGGKVVAEGRCTDQSECATKMEDMLSAHRDVECIYAMVGDYTAGSLSAMANIGVSPKMYLSNIDGDSAQYIKDGTITAGNDGTLLPPLLAATLMMNYLAGNKIVGPDGKAAHLQTVPIEIDQSNVDLYIDVFCSSSNQPMSDDLLKSLVVTYNPDVNYDYYVDVINNKLGLDELAEGLGLK